MEKTYLSGLLTGIFFTLAFVLILLSFYTVSSNKFISKSEYDKIIERMENDFTPPPYEKIFQEIEKLDHQKRAFAFISYDEAQKMFQDKWKLIDKKKLSLLELSALKEFALSERGFDEYKSLLKLKYGENISIPSRDAILSLPLPLE
jgi:hypothetical protein